MAVADFRPYQIVRIPACTINPRPLHAGGDFRPKCRADSSTNRRIGAWCNGSTADFDSACLGSNPGAPATFKIVILFKVIRPIALLRGRRPNPFLLRAPPAPSPLHRRDHFNLRIVPAKVAPSSSADPRLSLAPSPPFQHLIKAVPSWLLCFHRRERHCALFRMLSLNEIRGSPVPGLTPCTIRGN